MFQGKLAGYRLKRKISISIFRDVKVKEIKKLYNELDKLLFKNIYTFMKDHLKL